MEGTFINGVTIISGGLIGLLLKKRTNQGINNSIHKTLGIICLIIGINGVITSMVKINANGTLSSRDELVLVVSLTLGMLIGELCKLEDRLNGLGARIEGKLKLKGFSLGFISASTIFCVGAMGIIGAINNGTTGDTGLLITKSVIDFTIAIVLAAGLGSGVVFSFVPVVVYEGTISIFAGFLKDFLVGSLLLQICMIGYSLIICAALNLIFNSKIKTVNMLPSILLPVAYSILQRFI